MFLYVFYIAALASKRCYNQFIDYHARRDCHFGASFLEFLHSLLYLCICNLFSGAPKKKKKKKKINKNSEEDNMNPKDKIEKMQIRQNYSNLWHTDLPNSIFADTPFCCFSLFCELCASYMLQKRALYNDMSRYICCAGYVPCSGESHCPELCLYTEVWCCFPNSVPSTRLLQDEFNIQTSPCDNCMIGFMFCLEQAACICSCVACITGIDEIRDVAQLFVCLADLVFCTVCPFIQTQHKVEMDKRDSKFGPPTVMSVPPPTQQMSRIDQPVPPAVGYSAEPHGHPPPHYAQYPPQAYPPNAHPK